MHTVFESLKKNIFNKISNSLPRVNGTSIQNKESYHISWIFDLRKITKTSLRLACFLHKKECLNFATKLSNLKQAKSKTIVIKFFRQGRT